MDIYYSIYSKQDEELFKTNKVLLDEALDNYGVSEEEEVKYIWDSHVKNINTLLNSGKTRERGVELLLSLIPQCPQQLLSVQGERWFRFCSQVISSVAGTKSKVNACEVIKIILRDLPYIPELQRSVLSKPAAPLVVSLAAADSQWSYAALDCLFEYLKLSQGQCLPHKTVLEEHILGYLDSPLTRVSQDDTVSRAGRVFAALPLPGMGGSGSQGRAEARGRQLSQLLALSHSLMDYLFDGIVESESYEHSREHKLHLATLTSPIETNIDPLQVHLAAVTRLVNTMKFIAEMITSDVNSTITFVPYDLLGAIFRLLQMAIKKLQSYHSQEHKLLAFLMPCLHQHCLLLLRDAILSTGESIDMYFGVIADLLVSIIKSSMAKNNPEWCTSGQQTRIIAYSVMSTIIQVSRGKHTPSQHLISLILDDVLPRSQDVKLLNKQDGGLASLSIQKKKSKKKGYTVTNGNSGIQAGPIPCPEYFSRTARVALSVIKTLFTYATHSMQPKSQQLLQASLLNLTASVTGSAKLPDLYMDGGSRAELFKTLASIASHPHPGFPPPYPMIMHLLQSGLNDPDMLVVSACQVALGNLSFIVANPQICLLAQAQQQQAQLANDQGEERQELLDLTQEDGLQIRQGNKEDEMTEENEEEKEDEIIGEEDGEKEDEIVQEKNGEEEELEIMEEENGEDKDENEEVEEKREEDDEDMMQSSFVAEEEPKEISIDLEEDEDETTEQASNQTDTHEKDQEDTKQAKSRKRKQRGWTTPVKRTAKENKESSRTVKRKEKDSSDSPSLEEILGSFVNCGPD